MKGSSKAKRSKKKHGTKAAGKPNGNLKRSALRAGNRAYNSWMRSHRWQPQPDGYPQGKHDAKSKATCRCGGCINAGLAV